MAGISLSAWTIKFYNWMRGMKPKNSISLFIAISLAGLPIIAVADPAKFIDAANNSSPAEMAPRTPACQTLPEGQTAQPLSEPNNLPTSFSLLVPDTRWNEIPSLVNSLENCGYLSTGINMQSFTGKQMFFASLHGGWMIERRIFVGLGAYWLLNPLAKLDHALIPVDNVHMLYAGLEGGWRFPLGSQLFLRTQLLLGITSMFYATRDFTTEGISGNDTLVMDPGLYLEIPLWKEFDVSMGTHYHYTLGVEGLEGVTSTDVNTLALEVEVTWHGF